MSVVLDTPDDINEDPWDYLDDVDWGDLEPTPEELDEIAAQEGQITAWEILSAGYDR